MEKQKITFDQLFQSVIYQSILNQGIKDEEFKPIIDSSAFQDEDMLEGYSLVMIKSYGGNRMAIEDIDATPMNIQIIVNTDDPQKWKRILTSIGDSINGKWNFIEWPEDEQFKNSFYHYYPVLNLPMNVGGENQVGTSTRYVVTMTGTIYYTSNPNLAPSVPIDVYDEETEEWIKVKYLLTNVFGYNLQTEAYQSNEHNVLENEERGVSRTSQGTFIFDKTCKAHRDIMKKFFKKNDVEKVLKIRIYIDDPADAELSTEMNIIVQNLSNNYIMGNSISSQFIFVESSD